MKTTQGGLRFTPKMAKGMARAIAMSLRKSPPARSSRVCSSVASGT